MNLGQQKFYGHGKLLLTGEYLVMEGAKAIALPTNFGQSMVVNYHRTDNPTLFWKSYDKDSNLWFEAKFELWHFNLLSEENEESLFLQNVLRKARAQNVHFLRDDVNVLVDCHLEFGLDWGLGSSSTLIYNVAQWAYISAFELHRNLMSGSGYDVACAQAIGPIFYQLKSSGVNWGTVDFNPIFKDKLYFVHLNKKQNSQKQVAWFKDFVEQIPDKIIQRINTISEDILNCYDLKEFEQLLLEHENVIRELTGVKRIQDELFMDYPGVIKSLGAWGGDFVLATSELGESYVRNYFMQRGFDTVLNYDEMIYQSKHLDFSASNMDTGVTTHELRS